LITYAIRPNGAKVQLQASTSIKRYEKKNLIKFHTDDIEVTHTTSVQSALRYGKGAPGNMALNTYCSKRESIFELQVKCMFCGSSTRQQNVLFKRIESDKRVRDVVNAAGGVSVTSRTYKVTLFQVTLHVLCS
jgi:hypothetical protein